jgi:hypothetical protein
MNKMKNMKILMSSCLFLTVVYLLSFTYFLVKSEKNNLTPLEEKSRVVVFTYNNSVHGFMLNFFAPLIKLAPLKYWFISKEEHRGYVKYATQESYPVDDEGKRLDK